MHILLRGLLLMIVFGAFLLAVMPLRPAEAAEAERAVPPRIPMEDFFRNPEKASFRISPDGKHYAFLMPWHDRLNIFVRPIGSEAEPVRITDSEARDIRAFGWGNSEKVIYLQDTGGDENYRVYSVGLDGDGYQCLTPFEDVRAGLVDILEDDPDHVLIDMNRRDRRVFDVYRLNIDNGELEMIAENPGSITGWGTDHEGRLRLAVKTEGLETTLLYRPSEGADWEELMTHSFTDKVIPAGFTADNDKLYMLSNLDRDTLALYRYDPAEREFEEMLYAHPEVDLGGIIWSDARNTLLGVTYYTDRLHRHFFDEQAGDFFAMLRKRFPGYAVGISSSSRDERKMIISVTSDRMPGKLYFFDRDKPGEFSLVADLYAWLDEDHLAEKRPITYTARDGLEIHGYLTLPAGREEKDLPVLVHPHGGPEARDHWGYDPLVQFLANRGMAVLQMNFRVSTGYGKDFWKAGFKQWGRKQQDDITDGVRWLIDRGIADPERIAIFGASYGGYATLMGLIKTPGLYACGIDYVGVTDLFTLFESIPPYWEPMKERMYVTIGHPEEDADLFRKVSPVFHAGEIEDPLLIAQGANDPRVVKKESDMMVEALREKGIEVEYMVKENEGHGFSNQENRFDLYRAVERFLKEHLQLER
ncbi:MAG: S9 family peptidase [Synergistales bacterium]|nr:S9 family peptidase [Synergistales bacterium]